MKTGEVLSLVGKVDAVSPRLAWAIVRLVEALQNSKVYYRGVDVLSLEQRQLKDFFKKAQMVFQDPSVRSILWKLTVG